MKLGFRRFGLGIAKGMALTFKHLARRPITVQYPEQRLSPSRRFRGNDFIWEQRLCTGCATCAKACPQGNIEIITSRNGDNAYVVEKFEIDLGRCIFCGLCVESCPYAALFMEWGYEKSNYSRRQLVAGKERLGPAGRSPSAYARPEVEGGLAEQTLLVYYAKKER